MEPPSLLDSTSPHVPPPVHVFLAPNPVQVPPVAGNDTEFYEKIYWTFTFSSFAAVVGLIACIIWVVAVNVLVVLGIYQSGRRLSSDLYTINLAVCDILVSVFVLPCMSIVVILGYFPFGSGLCSLWIFWDYYLIFAASLGYAALIFCYLWMITWPKHFSKKDWKTHVKILVSIWVILNVAWTPAFAENRMGTRKNGKGVCGYDISVDRYTTFYLGVFGLYIPCILSVVCALWCAYGVYGYNRRDRITFRDIVPLGLDQAPIFMIKVFPVEQEKTGGVDYLDVGMNHVPSIIYLLSAFVASRLLFYAYFGVGAFAPELFPPDLSNGVYWVMHSSAGVSPLLHILLDKQIRDGILSWIRSKSANVVTNEIVL